MKIKGLALAAAVSSCALGCTYAPYAPARSSPFVVSTPDVARAQGFFIGVRGTKIFEQSWRPVKGTPRAAMVLVHGLKDHSRRYEEIAARLVAQNYAVYAFDLRGHGHSEGVRVDVVAFRDYLDDLDLELALVRRREPGAPIFLFGHSMGGAIVTLDAIERKPDVRGIVLSGAALEANVNAVKIVGTKIVAAFDEEAPVFNLDLHDFSRDPKVVEEGEQDPLVYQGGAPARTARELLGAIDTIDDRMEDFTVPLLALHGSADTVTPPQGSKDLVRRARSTDKTLKLYDGLVHDLLHEPEKARVEDDILAWLNQRAPQR